MLQKDLEVDVPLMILAGVIRQCSRVAPSKEIKITKQERKTA